MCGRATYIALVIVAVSFAVVPSRAVACWGPDSTLELRQFFQTADRVAVEACLRQGVHPDTRDYFGWLPLEVALYASDDNPHAPGIIRALIEAGADLSYRDSVTNMTLPEIARLLRGENSPTHSAFLDSANLQAGAWGAIFWAIADELSDRKLDYIHLSERRCHHVAGMAWNYQTKRDAMKAARDACKRKWQESGTRVRVEDADCGDLQYDNPISAGTVLGVIFGPGQCAAYAEGRHVIGDAKCPVSGTGVGASKSEAVRNALAECEMYGSCRIKMSTCNASP